MEVADGKLDQNTIFLTEILETKSIQGVMKRINRDICSATDDIDHINTFAIFFYKQI